MVQLPQHNNEPGKVRAAVLAVLVHVVLLVILVFGLNWKNEVSEAISVDLWTELPASAPSTSVPAVTKKAVPPPKTEKVVQPKSEPQLQSQPQQTQPQPVPQTPTPSATHKPDIELKDAKEKPILKKEAKKSEPVKKEAQLEKPVKKPAHKPVQPVAKAKEEVKQPDPVKKIEPKAEQKEVVQQPVETKQQPTQHKQDSAAAAAQARAAGEIEKYKAMIQAKIRNRIIMPPDLPGDPAAEFMVTLLPGGDVLAVTLRQSSGYPVFDEAVERAIYLAKPLPLPPDAGLFNAFRNLNLTVYYHEKF